MPELPEVHTFQQYFNEAALGVPIMKVVVHDDKIIRNVDGQQLSCKLNCFSHNLIVLISFLLFFQVLCQPGSAL